jgi:DNA repair exonuclease SbcCD nuclease subunit
MKIVAIGDIHLSKYSQDKIEDSSNLPERLHSIKQSLYEVAIYCRNNGIDTIIIAGDLLHGKSIIYAIAQELMLNYFKDFNDLQFIVIDGNHDLSAKGKDTVSALRPLEQFSNVQWIRFDTTYHLQNDDMLFIPYSYNLPQVIKSNKARILVSHFGLSEATLNSGMSIISDISLKDLQDRYELVILGHYHKPQEIIRENIKIYYTGSVIQLDWGEKGEEKRFLVIDTETLEVDSVPLSSYKKHIEIEVTADNIDDALKEAKLSKEKGDHVKVILKEKVDIESLKGDYNIVDKTEKNITNRGITSTMSQVDKFKTYLDINEIPEEEHKFYLEEILKIIENCEGK